MKQSASLLAHLRDILLFPVMITIVIPFLIDKPNELPTPFVQVMGVLILLSGLALFSYTILLFRIIGKGTLAPWSPKRRLIITGPYRYCRNPMITGVFLILIGETVFFWSSSLLTYSVLFFTINTFYFMAVEEPGLKERFGDDYSEYKIHVPRWLPRLRPYSHL